jgi:hypothetical protein
VATITDTTIDPLEVTSMSTTTVELEQPKTDRLGRTIIRTTHYGKRSILQPPQQHACPFC